MTASSGNESMSQLESHWRRQCERLAEEQQALLLQAAILRDELGLLRTVHSRDAEEQEALRRSVLATQDEADRQGHRLVEARYRLEEARSRIRQLEDSTSFRLGYAAVSAFKSPRAFLALPRTLWGAFREARLRRSAGAGLAPDRSGISTPATPDADPWSVEPDRPAAVTMPASVPGIASTAARDARAELPENLEELRVAAVMDEFTRACFAPVCQLQTLHADRYEQQLRDCAPHLLLVESAWRGDGDSWRDKIASGAAELRGLLDMCRRRGVPTAFWNKEDPSHFDTFLETARLFDYVFTTDIDSIRRYRRALGHDRIHLLPFACQPRIHNPLVQSERRQAFCFAGAYYHRYPERCRDFERLISTLDRMAPVVIYDRNSERGDPGFAFPRKYAGMLRPALPYDRIDEAYKGYRFALNLNTIKQSQSMFARRVYELLACNTVTVSNYSRGLRRLFGNLVIASDMPVVLEAHLQALFDDPGLMRRLRLHALRKVLQEHTYQRRMQYAAGIVLGQQPVLTEPAIVAIARVSNENELRAVLSAFDRQAYARRRLKIVVSPSFSPSWTWEGRDVGVLREADARTILPAEHWGDVFVAAFHPEDHYGRHYLTDLALALGYSGAQAVGKAACYVWSEDGIRVEHQDLRYRPSCRLQARSCLVPASSLGQLTLLQWLDRTGCDSDAIIGVGIDEFSYCRYGANRPLADVDGVVDGLDSGASMGELLAVAERLRSDPLHEDVPSRSDAGVRVPGADFRAILPGGEHLFMADSIGRLGDLTGGDVAVDRFVMTQRPSSSFLEVGGVEIMQGGAQDLRDLLETGRYRRLWVCAPGSAVCNVLHTYAARLDMLVRLTDDDLHAAKDRSESAWLALCEGAYPRMRFVLDRTESLTMMEMLHGQRMEQDRCLVVDALPGYVTESFE